MDNKNQCALITGATSGICYELAKVFSENGYNLVGGVQNWKIVKEKLADAAEVARWLRSAD